MQYRKLGRTGLSVSRVGYGGENITDADFPTTETILRRAMELGINIMDVFMPQPQVRTHMGDALRGYRQKVLLQGHIGAVLFEGQYDRRREVDLCDEYVRDFLSRFHTDYIDIGMMHFIDTQVDYDASFNSPYIEYVQKLKKDGVIRTIGVSSHNPVIAKQMVKTGLIDVLMFSINPAFDLLPAKTLIDDYFTDETYAQQRFAIDPDRASLYTLCEQMGVAITVMKTLGGGRLLNAKASSFGVALTPVQCIHYALERPGVASVLMGARSVQELEACVAYETAGEEQKDYSLIASGSSSAMRGSCMYCNHCLPCPSGIDIASVTKYLDIARMSVPVEGTLKAHYTALSAHGGDCIACGQCEPRCPFGVSIRKNMAAARDCFGQ